MPGYLFAFSSFMVIRQRTDEYRRHSWPLQQLSFTFQTYCGLQGKELLLVLLQGDRLPKTLFP